MCNSSVLTFQILYTLQIYTDYEIRCDSKTGLLRDTHDKFSQPVKVTITILIINFRIELNFQKWLEWKLVHRRMGISTIFYINYLDKNKIRYNEKNKTKHLYYFVNIYRLIQIYQPLKLIRKQTNGTWCNSVITINPDNVSDFIR